MARICFSLLCILAVTGCESARVSASCPAGYRLPQFLVAVTDSATGAALAAIASGEVQNGASVDSLRRGPLATPPGAIEYLTATIFHAGDYTVRVRAPGYLNWQQEVAVAPGDGSGACPVPLNVTLAARLQPAP